MTDQKSGQRHPGGGQGRRDFKRPQGGKDQAGGQRHAPGGAPHGKGPREPRTITYFVDDKPNADLVDAEAERIGRKLARDDDLKSSQLRRYYEDVLNLRNRLEAEIRQTHDAHQAFEILRADFKMLRAKAHYAHGRDPRMFPQRLLDFINDHVHSVKNADDFGMFCKQFQAVVAFHRFHRDNRD